jgi:hypothetical protein
MVLDDLLCDSSLPVSEAVPISAASAAVLLPVYSGNDSSFHDFGENFQSDVTAYVTDALSHKLGGDISELTPITGIMDPDLFLLRLTDTERACC